MSDPMINSSSRVFSVIVCFSLATAVFSCNDRKAQKIVDDAIEAHGGSAFNTFFLEFDFRNRHYTVLRKDGLFTYTREFTDSTGRIRDMLTNSGFTRYLNDSPVALSGARKNAFKNSVNSVIYFALLPFGLNDDAANKEWVEETNIRGVSYDLVRVTFDHDGGGEDPEDVFLYWFNQERKTMDYLAYSFHTGGGGLRFREAVNPRTIGRIRLQDYINYKPANKHLPLDSLQSIFVSGHLQKLSEIKLENAAVTEPAETR
jgi:hypothetical protein